MHIQSVGTNALWISFTLFILAMLALDLGVFHRRVHKVSIRESLLWTSIWIGLAMLFNVYVYYQFGIETALQFTTGFLIEKALSVDNIFIFLVIFSYFKTPEHLQHRVLFWGILGAIVLRFFFIVIGSALIQEFHWIMYVFGAFLVFTGIKLILRLDAEIRPEKNPMLRLFKRIVPSVGEYQGAKFFIRLEGRTVATPLFMVLVVVEVSDIVFAIDSIPAVFAITSDPIIVYTSNIFAILGLRALYFALAGIMTQFHHLKKGLAFILIFVGIKMLIADIYKIPIFISLSVIAFLLMVSILASMLYPPSKLPPEKL